MEKNTSETLSRLLLEEFGTIFLNAGEKGELFNLEFNTKLFFFFLLFGQG